MEKILHETGEAIKELDKEIASLVADLKALKDDMEEEVLLGEDNENNV
jgi:hypothetical protein